MRTTPQDRSTIEIVMCILGEHFRYCYIIVNDFRIHLQAHNSVVCNNIVLKTRSNYVSVLYNLDLFGIEIL